MPVPVDAVKIVLDEETEEVDERPVPLPPMLYVPCESFVAGESVDVAFRRTLDGRIALLVYTALDRLLACCGDGQPWFLMETDRLDELDEHFAYDVIFVDMEIPEEERFEGPPPEQPSA